KNGGIIGLITINNKIRFEINLGAINNNQLKISSKLLRLAKAVYHKPVSD
ncbi:MAG TPA: YfiR family protein, partial [Gammaproteobacteria bacterium]|nr:YfiR family protein [Gammaproteobacteria bacterium]